MPGEAPRPPTLAEKLDRLFAADHARGGREHTYRAVAEAIQARGGPTISVGYLWQLRKGVKDNPTKKQLEALAAFFGVSPAYFFDDAQARRIDAELGLLVALRDAGVRHLAFRANGLSTESLRRIAELIDHVRQLERLPEPADAVANPESHADATIDDPRRTEDESHRVDRHEGQGPARPV
ncbi:MAG TPA: hypothetical protein VFW96_03835 [Thermomicrobiales bacterium]|nr:hypothetical protein [Thermomicrobiales bacterium]